MANTLIDPFESFEEPEEIKEKVDDGAVAGEESYSVSPVSSTTKTLAKQLCIPLFEADMQAVERAEQSSLGGVVVAGPNTKNHMALMVRSTDFKNFRVYMKTEFIFTSAYITALCRFLDSRKEGETVTFILGTKMSDSQAHIVGPIIAAIQNCKASVRAIAAGYCSVPETIIWCFCPERDVYRYGALSFCHTEIIQVCGAYRAYFELFYNRAVEIGVLSQEQVDDIWKTGREMMILYSDYQTLTQSNPTPSPQETASPEQVKEAVAEAVAAQATQS